jgi:hypothetical protein
VSVQEPLRGRAPGPAADRAAGAGRPAVRPLTDLGAGAQGRVVGLRLEQGQRPLPEAPLRPGATVYVVEAGGGRWLHVRIDFREYSVPVDLAERVLVAVAGTQPAPRAAWAAADVYAVLVSRLAKASWRVRVIERASGTVARSEWFEAEADARRRFRALSRDAAGMEPAAFRARYGLP